MKGFMNTFKKKKSEKKSSKVEAPPKNTSNASFSCFSIHTVGTTR